jgi:hypothetical protein
MVLLASALLATTAAATAAAAAPRPGQTPQHEQLNPNVAYRVANSVQPGAQFFMGGDGQSYFDVLTPPIRTRYAEALQLGRRRRRHHLGRAEHESGPLRRRRELVGRTSQHKPRARVRHPRPCSAAHLSLPLEPVNQKLSS